MSKSKETNKAKVIEAVPVEDTKDSDKKKSSKVYTPKEIDPVYIYLIHGLGIIGSIIPPIVGYLVSEDKTIRMHSKSAFNFQLNLLIYIIVFSVVSPIITLITFGLALIVIAPLWFALMAIAIVLPILACVTISKSDITKPYKYPFTIEFWK